jgi:hypothetical protein
LRSNISVFPPVPVPNEDENIIPIAILLAVESSKVTRSAPTPPLTIFKRKVLKVVPLVSNSRKYHLL